MAALIGNGSHGRDIQTVWRRATGGRLDVYDERRGPHPVKQLRAFIGVLDGSVRREIAQRRMVLPVVATIDPAAQVDGASPGIASVVMAGAVVIESGLGWHVHVGCNATIMRARLADYVTVCPGATICGDTAIGDESFIGAGATICDRVKIGKRCRIGAGAVVPPESVVPDDTTVVGVFRPVPEPLEVTLSLGWDLG